MGSRGDQSEVATCESGSHIFVGFRALGLVSDGIPFQLRYIRRRKEFLINTSVGNTFLTYGSSNLRLLSVSRPMPQKITCMASDSVHVFTGVGKEVYGWRRGTELHYVLKGHDGVVSHLLTFGVSHLISIDVTNTLRVWDITDRSVYLELNFPKDKWDVSVVMHPDTYLNKVLLGSKQGGLQLWNVKSGMLIHSFEGWKSEVTVLKQSPAVDVVAVGLEDGRILIHDLKFDRTLMTFSQEWGRVSGLSFRTDDSDKAPILASGSSLGHVALWNLQERKLSGIIHEAHSCGIAGLEFLPGEALLVTNSEDNSLKMWTFDLPDGGARLLRIREGFSASPTCVHFYDSLGKSVLAASGDGTLRSFSLFNDMLHQSLGRATWNHKRSKKLGAKHDQHLRMSPIVRFASETIREQEWDNLIAVHEKQTVATSWSLGKTRIGDHKMVHRRFKEDPALRNAHATCCAMSPCGNFSYIGYSSGHVDMFNMQSGLHRGTAVLPLNSEQSLSDSVFPTAHAGEVKGVACDSLNQRLASAGADGMLRFWRCKNLKFFREVNISSISSGTPPRKSIEFLEMCRASNLLATVASDHSIYLVDMDTGGLARSFPQAHSKAITAVCFSSDGRWLVSAGLDSKIITRDVVTGNVLDSFVVPSPCLSLGFSPTSEFIATCHQDQLGVYLWANKTLFSPTILRKLPSDHIPLRIQLPGSAAISEDVEEVQASPDGMLVDDGENKQEETEVVFSEDEETPLSDEFEESGEELITLSEQPSARWNNLLHLDVIRARNKPKEAPVRAQTGPFFLPTVPGLEFRFDTSKDSSELKANAAGRIFDSVALFEPTEWGKLLLGEKESKDFATVFERFKELGPSKIDTEIRSLIPQEEAGMMTKEKRELLCLFLEMIDAVLKSKKDYELAQAYLGLCLQIHWPTILESPDVRAILEDVVQPSLESSWSRLEDLLDSDSCLVNFLQSIVL